MNTGWNILNRYDSRVTDYGEKKDNEGLKHEVEGKLAG